jgi:predicted PurR-regulated permease PerM
METLLTIITILQRAGGKRLLLRLFSRFVILLGLVITAAIMVSAALIGFLIHIHLALLDGAVPSSLALLIVSCAALLIIAGLVAMIISQLKGLRHLPKHSPLMDSLDAFADGLMATK